MTLCFLTFLKKYILDIINPVSDVELAKILSYFVACVFTWSIVSFIVPKHFSFIKSLLPTVGLNSWGNRVLVRKAFPIPRSCRALPMFSSSGFRFPVPTFKFIEADFSAK